MCSHMNEREGNTFASVVANTWKHCVRPEDELLAAGPILRVYGANQIIISTLVLESWDTALTSGIICSFPML